MRSKQGLITSLGLIGAFAVVTAAGCGGDEDGNNRAPSDCGAGGGASSSSSSASSSSSSSSSGSSSSSASSSSSGASSSSSGSSGACVDGDVNECYSAPFDTLGVGICMGGTQTCVKGVWSACENEQTPLAEVCGDGLDNDCNGSVDEPCPPPPAECLGAGDVWHFGAYGGLKFTGGAPTTIQGPIATAEGTATISDCSGNLRVSSDGSAAYDSNGDLMPNGSSGLGGDSSSLQSALLLADPGSSDVIHLFSIVSAELGLGPLHHTRIDMTARGGLGDVDPLQKADAISPSVVVTERLLGVKHANGVDDWILVHEHMTDMFQAYRLSAGQIGAPVESHTGAVADGVWDFYGALAASRDGKRLATAYYGSARIDVYNFDNTTGVVSLAYWFPAPCGGYGMEFSPNGKVLYMTCYNSGNGNLYQYDLSLPADQIPGSQIELGPADGQIKRGPDGRVYTARYSWALLGVVANPDVVGLGAGYDPTAIALEPGTNSWYGLPNVPPGLY